MDLTAQILLQIAAVETTTADLSSTVTTTNINQAISLATGTGANQAQIVWSDSAPVADAGDLVLDLAALVDARGTVAFSALKLIYIKNTGTVPVNLIGNGDWNTGPQKLPDAANYEIPAGGIWLATNPSAAGWAVAAAPQNLSIQNQSATTPTTIDIILIGEGSIT